MNTYKIRFQKFNKSTTQDILKNILNVNLMSCIFSKIKSKYPNKKYTPLFTKAFQFALSQKVDLKRGHIINNVTPIFSSIFKKSKALRMAVMKVCCGCMSTRSGTLCVLLLYLVRISDGSGVQKPRFWKGHNKIGLVNVLRD